MKAKITILLLGLSSLFAFGQEGHPQDSAKSKDESLKRSADYPGGIGKFYMYIGKNLKFPKDAKRSGITGRVVVEFVINKDGAIEDETITVVEGLNESCNHEAIRLIKACPNWIPGEVDGKPVRQRMKLPIMFK